MKGILRYYIRVWMLLFPLVFLPIVTDRIGFGKIWLLGAGMGVGLIIWLGEMILEGERRLYWNRFLGWYLVLLGWGVLSFWRLGSGERISSLFSLFGFGTLAIVGGWMFLWIQVASSEEQERQLKWLTGAGVILAAISVAIFLIPNSKLPWSWPKENPIIWVSSNWSPAGSLVAELVLMLVIASEWLRRLVSRMRKNQGYVVEAAVVAIMVLVIGLDVYRTVRTDWLRLDGESGWVVAVEAFKRSPVWGVGVGRFGEAFNKWRPVSYNGGKYWATGFNLSSSLILQIWTELGGVGLAVVLVMLTLILRQKKNSFEFWQVLGFFVGIMLLPWEMVLGMLLGWLLAANKLVERGSINLAMRIGSEQEKGFNAAPWLTGVLIVAVVGLGGFWWVKIVRGEWYLRKAILAATKNNGGETYNLQIKAIGANPYQAEYRRLYSQTNLALALNLLQNKDIGDEDKQKAAVLVQQAVREGKAAVALDNQNAAYWNNLAVIYRQLIGLVDGTADWSFQAYSQASVLDPVNVLTGLDMGGLLFAAGRFADAERVFEQVVMNKQDYANGWYNWAYAAKRQEKLNEAVLRLQQALLLVPVDSGDYDKASQELVEWKKELEELMKKQGASAAAAAPKPETLKTPEPLPTVSKEEKVDVPASELEPPKSDLASPTPTESTPTPASP